ncbi:DUF6055 domain-containing protein [Pedobacter sp. P26]|uniref:DUF6055 domain-containing protein n=1 Tax=Pedobacter sp. P26 TaxID=3423956 RepID=UPI003D675160
MSDSFYQPDASFCPKITGYNVIPLKVSNGNTTVSAFFQIVANAPGFNAVNLMNAGWRYGYVALMNDGFTYLT